MLFAGAARRASGTPPARAARGRALAARPPLALAPAATDRLGELFVTILKVGAVLYGSGYVLLTFLDGDSSTGSAG